MSWNIPEQRTSETKVLLMFGGESSEHDVSIASAHNVFAALDGRYRVNLCYITRGGQFRLVDSIDGRDSGVDMRPILGEGYLVADGSRVIRPDVIIPVLHGSNGEDGVIQGLADLLHIPCVGPSLTGAAISMDKDITKRLVAAAGIPVADWLVWHRDSKRPVYAELRARLGETMFVKPACAGSSIGVSKVRGAGELDRALKAAAQYDERVMIEAAIDGREIEISVLGNEDPTVSRAGEVVPGREFYTYEDKYDIDSVAQIQVPAQLDLGLEKRLQDYALTAYKATRGHGMARIDFYVTSRGDIYLGEINGIPGFTNSSMYPKLWRQEGVMTPVLIDRLIELAMS